VQSLGTLRGLDTIASAGLAAAIGDPSRFASAPDFMAYLGLVPSEHSSGPKRRMGAITKNDDVHPSSGYSNGFAAGTSYGVCVVKWSFLISWCDLIRGSNPSSIMRQRWPHHLVSGRTLRGPDHNPSCLRARARRDGTLLGSAACFSPGSGRSPSTPDQRFRSRRSRGLGYTRRRPVSLPGRASARRRSAPGRG
jgi:Transposase IS116/IS110/IS902 family